MTDMNYILFQAILLTQTYTKVNDMYDQLPYQAIYLTQTHTQVNDMYKLGTISSNTSHTD